MGSEEIGQRDSISRIMGSSDSMSENVAGMSESFLVDHFHGSCWDPMISDNLGNSSIIPQNEFVNPHYLVGNSSHLAHYTSDLGLVLDMVPKIPSFGSGSFSEMANSSFGQINESGCHSNLEDGLFGASLNGKRKRKVSPSVGGSCNKNVEEEKLKNQKTGNTCEFPKEDEKKNTGTKQGVKQAKDGSNGAEPSKEDYILVRAKRGQATNSHSLAERVRRERISERMRLLQELVPGCNKITGKAVMLDEIINYVQSLQQQVEFLSMKLATVNPELNVDIDRILSKDLLHTRGGNATELGVGPGFSPSHAFPGLLNGYAGPPPPFHPLPPNLWNSDLQSILQMGFDPSPTGTGLGANGLSKTEP
ncbi:hypothetical protein ABFS82_14G264400 [Erythranthe guttata]|uniref:BHLH domain-containing protein n=1 Tax=Erythranthe guttata TaxID=4155 RepID=A0A022R8T2_ERYGU|nr:PREDICTED: transcription factor bHLH74 [Erythranthe guttata]EYU36399.1 hypothetical protein MIMGU_mgv1a008799mg [Erythranthe guttata]|eukprot:XP_012838797.1 PREDICTED: transcription factor bHLH74 [Erythranthe guttata]